MPMPHWLPSATRPMCATESPALEGVKDLLREEKRENMEEEIDRDKEAAMEP